MVHKKHQDRLGVLAGTKQLSSKWLVWCYVLVLRKNHAENTLMLTVATKQCCSKSRPKELGGNRIRTAGQRDTPYHTALCRRNSEQGGSSSGSLFLLLLGG